MENMTTMLDNALGCNLLYPDGRLVDARQQFGLDAHKRAVTLLRDAGFEACEVSHYEVLPPQDCRALRKACEEVNVTPWSAHSWVTLPADDALVEERTHLLSAAIDAASDLGVRVLVMHADGAGGDLNDPDVRHRRTLAVEGCLLGAIPKAIAADIRIAVENCGGDADTDFLIETINRLNLPNVGFCIDTGHAVLRGLDPADVIRRMGAKLFTTHLQDNYGRKDDHLPPGNGTSVIWPEVIQAFEDIGYDGVLMVEISDCPPDREPNPAADTAAAFANLQRFLGRDA